MTYLHLDLSDADLPPEVEVVQIWPHEFECHVCEQLGPWRYSLAMYEGDIVDERVTDDWGGFPVCDSCWEANKDRLGPPIRGKTP